MMCDCKHPRALRDHQCREAVKGKVLRPRPGRPPRGRVHAVSSVSPVWETVRAPTWEGSRDDWGRIVAFTYVYDAHPYST